MSQELESLLIKILGDATGIKKATDEAKKAVKSVHVEMAQGMKSAGAGMMQLGKSMSKYVTAPILAGVSASVYAFASFDEAMTESTAIMRNLSDETRAAMEDQAMAMSDIGVQSSTELAESYYFLASAGMSAKASMAALPAVQAFATAGAFDMALATDLLTDAQSALGMSYKDPIKNTQEMIRLSDGLVGAATLANTSVQQISESLTNDAASASTEFGMSLNTTLAILDKYGDKGKKGAEAGSMLGRATRLMSAAFMKNGTVFEEYGIKVVNEATGEYNDFIDIIGDMEGAFEGMTGPQRAAAMEQLGFAALAQKSINPLLGQSEAMRGYTKELSEMAGVTQEVSDKNLSSFSAQMKIVWNQITNVSIMIGKRLAPYVRDLSNGVKKLIVWWKGLSDGWKDFILISGLVLAGLGPLIFGFGALLVAVGSTAAALIFLMKAETIATIKRLAHTAVTWLAVAASVALKIAMMAIPFALFAVGVTLVVKYAMSVYEANENMKKLNAEKERGLKLDDKMSKSREVGNVKQIQELGGMEGDAKTKALEAAVERSKKDMDDIAGNVKNAQKEADKLAPTMLSLGQAGKHVWEEQLGKVKTLDAQGMQELEHYEKMQKMLEEHKAKMAAIQKKESGGGVEANIIAKETAALAEMNTSLIEQQATVGMTSSEIEVYRAELKGASEEQLHSLRITQEANDAMEEEIRILEEEEEAIQKREDLYKNMNEQMDTQIATMNMSTAEIALYTAAQEGLSDIELAILKIKSDKIEKMKEEKKLMDEGEKLTKALRKPAEKLADGQEKLKEMLELGAISVETYGRAMEKLEKDMQVKVSFSVSGIDAVASGSLEAMARVEEFRAMSAKPNKVDFRKEGQAIVDAPKIAAEGEAIAEMWKEDARRQKTSAHKQGMAGGSPNAPIDTAQAGMGFATGLNYSDLPGAPQMNVEQEAEAVKQQQQHMENIKVPLPPIKSQAQIWQENLDNFGQAVASKRAPDANPNKPPVYQPDVHSVFSSGNNTVGTGSGEESEIVKETRDSNQIVADNTGRIATVLEDTQTAGFN